MSNILALTNNYRSQYGLNSLSWSQSLANSALEKAQDLCTHNYWGHNRPGMVWTTIIKKHYNYIDAGENLAKGFSSDQGAMNGWINSPTHQANLVGKYTQLGTATYNCQSNGLVYRVQHFGTPVAGARASTPPPPAPTQPVKPKEIKPVPATPTEPKPETSHIENVEKLAEQSKEEPKTNETVAQNNPPQELKTEGINALSVSLLIFAIVLISFIGYKLYKFVKR